MKRFRSWRLDRRLGRILSTSGWPMNRRLFSGKVKVTETFYDPDTVALQSVVDAQCVEFGNFYVEHYAEPREKA